MSKTVQSYKNSKGKEYWFHQKGHLKYFSKDSKGALELPEGFEVKENAKTGMLMASRKDK